MSQPGLRHALYESTTTARGHRFFLFLFFFLLLPPVDCFERKSAKPNAKPPKKRLNNFLSSINFRIGGASFVEENKINTKRRATPSILIKILSEFVGYAQ